jgi:hypothetical protein
MEKPLHLLTTENIFLITDELSLKDKLLFDTLVLQINDLINNDFERLVSLLYRIDVSEKKLTILLQENKTGNTAELIANLIIERQLQKIISRRETKKDNFNDEEKW